MKKCSKCLILKDFSEYHRHKNSPDGYKPRCKDCRNADNAQHRKDNPDYYQKWRANNKDYIKDYNAAYIKEHRNELTIKYKEYYASNPNKKIERNKYKKQWYDTNKDRIMADKYKRYKEDIYFRLAYKLRSRFYAATKYNYKVGSAVRDLGCSIENLKKYLESKFQPGMNWDNYREWHIDHIMPLASFDLTDYEQVKRACHYTNLQPLWAEDNLKKGAKMPFKEI